MNTTRLVLAALLASAALASAAGRAQEDIASHFQIDDADPESRIPSSADAVKAPLQMGYWIMLITERGDQAMKSGNLEVAARYFRALAKAVPDRRSGFARLCRVYRAMGDSKRAIDTCQEALAKPGAQLEDAIHLVQVLLAKEGELSQAEIAHIDAVLAHLAQETKKAEANAKAQQAPAAPEQTTQAAPHKAPEPGGPTKEDLHVQRVVQAQLLCELGTRLRDEPRLDRCTAALAKLAPNEPKTFSFAFALALVRGDFERAKSTIEGAKRAGLPDKAIALMKRRLLIERERQSLAGRVKALAWEARRNPHWLAYAGIALLTLGAAILLRRRNDRPAGSAHSAHSALQSSTSHASSSKAQPDA